LIAQPPCINKNDFTCIRNLCNPLTIQFLTNSTAYNSINWDFGNGNTIIGTSNPINTYSDAGNYQIKMIQNYGNCIDTVVKQVTVDLQIDTQLIKTSDTTICFGSTIQLLATPSLNFCWSPSNYLSNPALSNPTTSTPQNNTYYYNTEIRGNNLIKNSDFGQGNIGFISDYLYSPLTGVPEGVYYVGDDILLWHPTMKPCKDHTTGNGKMLLVNGATIADVTVWEETVTVQPNTNYEFSTWLQHITSVNPAKLQFSINGIPIGYIFQANINSCIWDRFYTTWNSGNNNSAVISIINC
jgi:PKD repeat protein